ncbi:DNA polymerase III subunit delta' [Bacillaceae bacterium S4-13-58]
MNGWEIFEQNQPNVVKMLQNSLKKGRISHAYLFQGAKGTGKKAISFHFAKRIFCLHPNGLEPCQQCSNCRRISSGNHPDVHWIEPDGMSIKKDQILHLQKEFTYTGMESNQKIYIIQGAEKMTVNASNRLLKFLEEPSKETVAILLTENGHALLDTIRSRCQIISFLPLSTIQLEQQLVKDDVNPRYARVLTALTNDPRKAMEWNENDWFANAQKIMIQLVEVFEEKEDQALLIIHQKWIPHFKDREQLQLGLDLLLTWYRDLMYLHVGYERAIIFNGEKERLERQTMVWSQQVIANALTQITEARRKLSQNVNPTLVMEQLTLHLQR